MLHRLVVPYRIDREDGTDVRVPDIPAGWEFEQLTALTDVMPGGRPIPAYRARRACIAVDRDPAEVAALVASYASAGRASEIQVDAPTGLAQQRWSVRHSSPTAARAWSVRRDAYMAPFLAQLEADDAAHGAVAAGPAVRAPAWLLPLLVGVGTYALARCAGLHGHEGFAPLLGFVTSGGTVLAEDAFSGSAGADIHGRTADTTDPGGTWQTYGGANGLELDGTGGTTNNGASAIANEVGAISGLSGSLGSQFSETKEAARNAVCVCTLVDYGAGTGYGARMGGSARVYRFDGGSNTQIASGAASAAGTRALCLESIAGTHSVYDGAPGSYLTSGSALTSASDSTYTAGRPGIGQIIVIASMLLNSWRGGSFGGAPSGPAPNSLMMMGVGI